MKRSKANRPPSPIQSGFIPHRSPGGALRSICSTHTSPNTASASDTAYPARLLAVAAAAVWAIRNPISATEAIATANKERSHSGPRRSRTAGAELPARSRSKTNQLQPAARAMSANRHSPHASSDGDTANVSPAAAHNALRIKTATSVEARIPPRQPSTSCAEKAPKASKLKPKLQTAGTRKAGLGNV